MIRFRLAPLCGVTDHVYRSICASFGCETAYTEMISAMGYLCAPNHTATRELMIRDPNESRLILQLFGKDPSVIAEAAEKIEETGIYDGIDINMGCPAHKVASSGEGSGLMLNSETAWRIMEQTRKSIHLPLSVKMRIGWDEEHKNILEYALMAQEAGIQEISIHGRTRTQQYAGTADWEIIQQVRERVHIPVIGNGDVFTAEEAINKLKKGYADGVMIGRGAMGNPWIFRDIQRMLTGETVIPVSNEERQHVILYHYHKMLETRSEHIAIREMRKFIAWYLHGLRGASRIRSDINKINDYSEAIKRIDQYFAELEEKP